MEFIVQTVNALCLAFSDGDQGNNGYKVSFDGLTICEWP